MSFRLSRLRIEIMETMRERPIKAETVFKKINRDPNTPKGKRIFKNINQLKDGGFIKVQKNLWSLTEKGRKVLMNTKNSQITV